LSKVDALSNSVKELKKMGDTLNTVISKVDSLEEVVKELQVRREPPEVTSQEELAEKAKMEKAEQDRKELDIGDVISGAE